MRISLIYWLLYALMLATLLRLQTRYRAALVFGLLLPAYLLVVCGLFSWLPVLWFGQQHHQFEAADTVSYTHLTLPTKRIV